MDRSAITLERMRSFVRVAERGNMSAVARELGIAQSSVTRHLRELEEALGISLLNRTTRHIALTDEGNRFYSNAVHIIRLVEQSADEAYGARGASAGTVRITCTAALGVRHISRLIFAFQERHPDIGIDLSLNDSRVDLVRDGADIALRLGPVEDSSMKLRALGASRRVLVASPAYLATHGRPAKPDDLRLHQIVRMSNVAGSDVLTLKKGTKVILLPVGGRLQVDHGLAAREAFAAGAGFGPAHLWLVDDLIADGRLEVILPDYEPPAVPLNMLIAPGRTNLTRVRLLLDFLVAGVLDISGIEAGTARL
jgi:DNA-binding transcriptional LysR family regulator